GCETDRGFHSQRQQQDVCYEIHPQANPVGCTGARALWSALIEIRLSVWSRQLTALNRGRLDAPTERAVAVTIVKRAGVGYKQPLAHVVTAHTRRDFNPGRALWRGRRFELRAGPMAAGWLVVRRCVLVQTC